MRRLVVIEAKGVLSVGFAVTFVIAALVLGAVWIMLPNERDDGSRETRTMKMRPGR
jgi:hypothetical protein